jgi:hypothetical protein
MRLLLACVDTRPGWDDTGVIAFATLFACALLGAAAPARPWVLALAVGVWVPVFNIAVAGRYAALIALLFAFAGAYADATIRKAFARAST